MYHNINAFKCTTQACLITNIPNKITNGRIVFFAKQLTHLKLLEFIAAEHHQTPDVRILLQHPAHKGFSKRSRPAGD